MMKTNLIAKTALLSCVVFFSGCTKTVYLPCKAEEPLRTYHKQCAGESSDVKFAECAASKYITLEGDYDVLLNRFRSCK